MEVIAIGILIWMCIGGIASLIYFILRYSRQHRDAKYGIPRQRASPVTIKGGKETSTGAIVPVARLTVVDGPSRDAIYDLYQRDVIIGRGMNNDIVINDPYITNQHARLTVRNGMYLLVDLASTNGTYINGQRIDRRKLNHQDIIELGRTKIRFEKVQE
jgi:pSer/pThr/pTyr-binding forkhead associated (FHA) protein